MIHYSYAITYVSWGACSKRRNAGTTECRNAEMSEQKMRVKYYNHKKSLLDI